MKALIAALLFAGLFVVPASAEECFPVEDVIEFEITANGATDSYRVEGDEAKELHKKLYDMTEGEEFPYVEANDLQIFTYPTGLAAAVVMRDGCAADFYVVLNETMNSLMGPGL
jgi:hypothetical protein